MTFSFFDHLETALFVTFSYLLFFETATNELSFLTVSNNKKIKDNKDLFVCGRRYFLTSGINTKTRFGNINTEP